MNRRGFLARVAVGAAALALVPDAALSRPSLYGDGVHDDTEAVQWRLDRGLPIEAGDYRIAGDLRVPSGSAFGEGAHFYIEKTMRFPNRGPVSFHHGVRFHLPRVPD